ncbi:MAG: SAM-dependent methyltransferase [Hyphomonas sp.]|nr:SAM-dependent methyltransferase [Hyphomonas sp.]|tara:strand:- start:10049 stop:10723 length:675 start_codon:yes stop_codon:yes gene_type:complete
MPDLSSLYRYRFVEAERSKKLEIWREICRGYLQKKIGQDQVILDLASGYGEFSQNIVAKRKIAVDLNPDAREMLPAEAEFHNVSATDFADAVGENSVDVVFTSNFLEHLPTKRELDLVFNQVMRVLKPGGRFMILGPNIKYLAGDYWDFYDHYLPLSHLSVEEGLAQSGFDVLEIIPKFLPYSTRSALPQAPIFVSTYLRLPLAWKVFGKQFLVTGQKPQPAEG